MAEACVFYLDCARYGDAEDLTACLAFGVDVNYTDAGGNTALHQAAANGEVECMKILKERNIAYCQNSSGNTPLHWAVQNQKLEAGKFIIENFEPLDVLQQNAAGRSALTDAFQTSNTELIDLCLGHPSSSEEKLLDKISGNKDVKITDETTMEDGDEEKPSVVHEFTFSTDEQYHGKTVQIRELPITNADNPFGTDTAPEDDTTGLGIWAASLLLSRYVLQLGPEVFRDKVVIELGAGCAVPGIVCAAYCAPRAVYVTDINEASLDNAKYNVSLNGLQKPSSTEEPAAATGDAKQAAGVVDVCNVNWLDPTSFPPEQADIILGSDLVYDSKIINILIPAICAMLSPTGVLLYSCLASERDGMDEFIPTLAEAGLVLVEQGLCPDDFYSNPLTSQDGEQYVLHFSEMYIKKAHLLYRFQRISAV
jgi:ribosomal protein L11 methylase PrmA